MNELRSESRKTIRSSEDRNFEKLAYIRPIDMRYFVVVVAACKIGYKVNWITRFSKGNNMLVADLTNVGWLDLIHFSEE